MSNTWWRFPRAVTPAPVLSVSCESAFCVTTIAAPYIAKEDTRINKWGFVFLEQSVLSCSVWASWPSLFFFLGGRLHDQMVKINQNLHRLQVAWRDAQQSSSPAADNLREQFERLMTIYLSTKTAMTEPQMLQNCLNLQVSMAVLLVQLAIGNEGSQPVELTFPLPDGYSSLAYVPGKRPLRWELPIYS